MRIVFYSTNSNEARSDTFLIDVMPDNYSLFSEFCQVHPEHEFYCITQKPAMFMPEGDSGIPDDRIIYLPENAGTQEVAKKIISLSPDLAIAMTFWTEPFDWLTMSDAIIAEQLNSSGINTICHPLETGLICFDKWRTHNELIRLGFDVPETVFSDHDLYFCAGSVREVLRNIYKESLIMQIKKMQLPLIIKDTTGLSSYGMTVVNTYGEAVGYLNSKRNNSNRLIQEFISGRQFGLEIYGVPGAYQVLPPFEFSVNQYGITSPKQSVKIGPVEAAGFEDLKNQLIKLSENLGFSGAAQIDLILDENNKWHIIEINPRLSGMSYTYAGWLGLSVFEMIFKACVEKTSLLDCSKNTDSRFVLNLKLPLMSESQMKEILKFPGVKLLNQTNDLAAKQEREKGFCECIIVAGEKSVLQKTVEKLSGLFPGDAIIEKAMSIAVSV